MCALRIYIAHFLCSVAMAGVPAVIDMYKIPPVVYDQVNELLKKLQQTDEGVVEVMDEIFAVFNENGLETTEVIHYSTIAVDPRNRDLVGLVPADAYKVGADVVGRTKNKSRTGFSFHEIESNCIVIELPPIGIQPEGLDGAQGAKVWTREEIIAWNEKLINLSGGILPDAKPLTWKYTAAAGTHMVVFCNCVNDMCVVPDEFHEVLAGQDGRVDKSQLMFHSPAFARAIEKGWNCKKLDWRVPFVWPSLVQFLQESRNVTARVCISETEPQTLFKIVNEISRRSAQHPDVNVDYSLVKRAVIRSAPPCAGYVDDMIKLAKVFLNDGNDLKDLDAFQKSCQYTSRQLGAKFFSALGQAHIGGSSTSGQKFRTGLCYAALASHPDKEMHGNICCAISPADIYKFADTSLNSIIQKCEQLMCTVQQLAHCATRMHDSDKVIAVGGAMMNIVYSIGVKTSKYKPVCATPEHACHDFVLAMNKHLKGADKIKSEWADFVASWDASHSLTKTGKNNAQPVINAYKRNNDGSLVDSSAHLRVKGFVVGKHITVIKTGEEFTITECTRDNIVITPLGAKKKRWYFVGEPIPKLRDNVCTEERGDPR